MLQRHTIVIGFVLIGMLTQGCGQSEKETPVAPETKKFESLETGPLPPPLERSKYIDKIEPVKYPPAKLRANYLLQWDFSKRQEWLYSYRENGHSASVMLGLTKPMTETVDGGATLLVKSGGANTAVLELRDFNGFILNKSFRGERKTDLSLIKPRQIKPMTDDGSLSEKEKFLKRLLKLPPKDLRINETLVIPERELFEVSGQSLPATGRSIVKFDGVVRIEGRDCARIETDILLDKPEIPEGWDGKYTLIARGKSVVYFDLDERVVLSGAVALAVSIRGELQRAKSGKASGAETGPDEMKLVIDADNFASITQKK